MADAAADEARARAQLVEAEEDMRDLVVSAPFEDPSRPVLPNQAKWCRRVRRSSR